MAPRNDGGQSPGRYANYARPPSDPPSDPPASNYLSTDPPASERDLRRLERRARRIGALKMIGASVLSACVAVGTGGTWAWHRAQAEILSRIDPACVRPVLEPGQEPPPYLKDRFSAFETKFDTKVGRLEAEVEGGKDPRSDIGRRLDSLDVILQKQFGESTKTTAPPKVGPTARQRGQQ